MELHSANSSVKFCCHFIIYSSGSWQRVNEVQGLQAALRDQDRRLLSYYMHTEQGCTEPKETKAWGFLKCLFWLRQQSYERVLIEVHSLQVVQAMKSGEENVTEFDNLGRLCREQMLASYDISFAISFVGRDWNVVAHTQWRSQKISQWGALFVT